MSTMTEKRIISFTLNGKKTFCTAASSVTLLRALREIGATSVKRGCEEGECGTCTVLVNGLPHKSCMILAYEAEDKAVTTVEGLAAKSERLHPIQQAYLDEGAIQCGFCTPGMILVTYALLRDNPSPSDKEIKSYMSGNLCRCTGYEGIFRAVRKAAELLRKGEWTP